MNVVTLPTLHLHLGSPSSKTMGASNPGSAGAHAQLLRQANLIIWEEMPLFKKVVWECVDQLLQDIMGNDLPFGGKAFLGLGDFWQVAPVIRGASVMTFDNSIRSSVDRR